MYDKNDKNIRFIIEGDEYKKLEGFKKEHKKCLERHPNMTGAQYEYSFVVDGFGVIKTVRCICGETIILDKDYNLGLSDSKMHREPAFQVIPEDIETSTIIQTLLNIKKRPGMYFGKHQEYHSLREFIGGYDTCCRVRNLQLGWYHIEEDVFFEFQKRTEKKAYSEEELFVIYLEILENILKEKYPAYYEQLKQ